ncbi:MAG: AAA family ATPase [Burkholderiales bacterium]|nr:AAA family ATPase [Burkholderiales bacterium]
MQILQVRFRNLNSLVGEWEIDFTQPDFIADGIFSITGPTGAGKTTILDAICLALYGRTPRLNKISKSENEIMSRQTGECFAEVTFATHSGRFRCHWGQHRARKKPEGELQNPRHELVEADSGKLLETRLSEVSKLIEQTTGMDFARFTRSMLLAQGEFAAFLQAAPDERAPILEQITGTGIYSRISIRVHETRAAARRELDQLTAGFNGIQLLTAAYEQQFHTELAQKIQQDAALGEQISRERQTLAWLENLARLEAELQQIAQRQQTWLARKHAFTSESNKLDLANRALELAGEYSKLASIRNAQEADQRNLAICMQTLPGLEQAARHTGQTLESALVQLARQRTSQQEATPLIRRVRELDVQIREKEIPVNAADKAVAEQQKNLAALRNQHQQDKTRLGSLQTMHATHLTELETIQADGSLVESLAGIHAQIGTLRQIRAQHQTRLATIQACEKHLAEIDLAVHTQTATCETLQKQLAHSQHLFGHKQAEYQQLLENRTLADWRQEVTSLTEHKTLATRAAEAVQMLKEAKSASTGLEQHARQLLAEQSALAGQLKTQETMLAAHEREINLLENQDRLLKTILHFEKTRQQLKEEEPCPLCGALHHPFATGNIPQPDETQLALSQAKIALKECNNVISRLKIRQVEITKDIEQIAARQQEYQRQVQANETLIHQCAVTLLPGATLPDLQQQLPSLLQKITHQLLQKTGTLQSAETLENGINTLRTGLDKTREMATLATQEQQRTLHQQSTETRMLQHIRQEAETLNRQLHDLLQKLQLETAQHQPGKLSFDNLDQIETQLTARRDQWLQRQQQKSALEQQINELTARAQHQSTLLRQQEETLAQQQQQLAQLQQELAALRATRFQLFAGKQTDQEEQQLAAAVEIAQKLVDRTRQQLEEETRETGKLKNRVEDLEKNMATRANQLNTLLASFTARLNQAGFMDETAFLAACLPEEERKQLAQQAQQLAEEKTVLDTQQKDKINALESERLKRMTDQPAGFHEQALIQATTHQQALQQEIGGIRQKLADNERIRQKQQEQLQAIEAQKRECVRWDDLHELIGSADGKKYRNFAQGLTFEVMIRHANRQLQKMSDRYLLIRDPIRPLELNVIDQYQAGEIRSTKNLSGGESFVISLALALGLSRMVSHHIRVDSLFLDEGFGTLDEEALDTALETLANLQQEGKLIGVISHVGALQERISTRIQVIPRSGGRSVLAGPGCRQH